MDYAYSAWANEAPVNHIAAYYEKMRLERIASRARQATARSPERRRGIRP